MRLPFPSPFLLAPYRVYALLVRAGKAVRPVMWPCMLGCALLTGCAEEGPQIAHHLPKADMTEAYPRKPFREMHHPLPPYWGGMVPMVQSVQASPAEATGRSVHTQDSGAEGVPHAPPQTQTDVTYGPPTRQPAPQ